MDEVPQGAADLLVVCTPASANEQIIRKAAERGVRAVFVTSGGYSETGDEGAAAESRLIALADELDLVLAGPNGQGITSPPVGLCAHAVTVVVEQCVLGNQAIVFAIEFTGLT